MADNALFDVGVLRLDAEYVAGIFFVGNAHIDIRHKLGHDLAGLFTRPQLFAVVEVAADLDSFVLADLECVKNNLGYIVAECRRDAGKMKPVRILEDLCKIKFLRRKLALHTEK